MPASRKAVPPFPHPRVAVLAPSKRWDCTLMSSRLHWTFFELVLSASKERQNIDFRKTFYQNKMLMSTQDADDEDGKMMKERGRDHKYVDSWQSRRTLTGRARWYGRAVPKGLYEYGWQWTLLPNQLTHPRYSTQACFDIMSIFAPHVTAQACAHGILTTDILLPLVPKVEFRGWELRTWASSNSCFLVMRTTLQRLANAMLFSNSVTARNVHNAAFLFLCTSLLSLFSSKVPNTI